MQGMITPFDNKEFEPFLWWWKQTPAKDTTNAVHHLTTVTSGKNLMELSPEYHIVDDMYLSSAMSKSGVEDLLNVISATRLMKIIICCSIMCCPIYNNCNVEHMLSLVLWWNSLNSFSKATSCERSSSVTSYRNYMEIKSWVWDPRGYSWWSSSECNIPEEHGDHLKSSYSRGT